MRTYTLRTINYIRNGRRTSISVTDTQRDVINYIKKRENIKSDEKFMKEVIRSMKGARNIAMATRDYIMLKLLTYIRDGE